MTNDSGILSNVCSYHGNKCVVVGNGATLEISHTGDAVLPLKSGFDLTLQDVLIIPHIHKNLLSISQLTTDYPCICEFSSIGFLIKIRRGGRS